MHRGPLSISCRCQAHHRGDRDGTLSLMGKPSRRSFMASTLATVAGAWATVTGIAWLGSGCSPAAKYGGPLPESPRMERKYGGPARPTTPPEPSAGEDPPPPDEEAP